MSIIVEGQKSFHIASAAWLVEQDRELAWAEKHVVKNRAYAWVLGKYVGTGKANDNGHIFSADELVDARQSLVHAPMNMLHRAHHIMGTYVANEVIWPKDAADSASVAAGQQVTETEPFLEALAAFYRYYFPDEYVAVEKAHKEGTLAWSMECVPQTVTCAGAECGKTFEYAGRQSESYCAHLNEPGAKKMMGKPHFTAGALVLPPARPAWRNASVTSLDMLVRTELEAAERMYNQVASEFPHLESSEWERMMELLLTAAKEPPQRTTKSPHKYKPLNGKVNAPCALCGLGSQDKLHNVPGGDERAAAERGRELAKEFSEDRRKKLAKEGKARGDGSFPIENASDLRNAIRAIGRAKNPAAAKAHIIRRARALGLSKLLPDGWS